MENTNIELKPQKTLTLDEAISLAGNSPREEPEFIEQWEKHNRILAAGIILARAGLSDEDFTLEAQGLCTLPVVLQIFF